MLLLLLLLLSSSGNGGIACIHLEEEDVEVSSSSSVVSFSAVDFLSPSVDFFTAADQEGDVVGLVVVTDILEVDEVDPFPHLASCFVIAVATGVSEGKSNCVNDGTVGGNGS